VTGDGDPIMKPATVTTGNDLDCKACAHAAAHGWFGTDLPGEAHCEDCHRYWQSHREAHCAACCRHFASNAAFDAHRLDEQCHDPSQLNRRDGQARFERRQGPYGVTWALVFYGELPDFDALG